MGYISKKTREQVKMKYGGLCAYSGTPLEDDWQVDHIVPIRRWDGMYTTENHTIENMVPVQRIINHYKHSLDLESFRSWFLAGLHERLSKLPKNPRSEKSIKKCQYLRDVASYFGITEENPFDGVFYFEKLM